MADEAISEYARYLWGQLDELLTTLNHLRVCAHQGTAADPDEVCDAVRTLTKGVCEEWSAICVKLPSPIEYRGRTRASHAELLYIQALSVYQDLMTVATGSPDDGLYGYYYRADEVWEKWPTAAQAILKPDRFLDLAEEARFAEIARRELLTAQPKPWPLPFVYQPPGSPQDGWSAEVAARQLKRLAAYRESGPPIRKPKPEMDDADLIKIYEGEPHDQFVTKLGGLPYRPASVPWPRTPAGEPMVFLGQICFADSRDLFDSLPGDVLLIFTHDEHAHTSGDIDDLRYEWYPLGLTGLVTAADVPDTVWKVCPCFTYLQRYLEQEDTSCPEMGKIGGRPHWIQNDPRKPGEFLAGFASVEYRSDPDPANPKVRHLDFFDAGLLHFFLRPDGHIVHYFQCY